MTASYEFLTEPDLRFGNFCDEWDRSQLGDLCSRITYGLTVRPKYIDKGFPLISAREITTGSIDYDSAPKISEQDFNSLSNKSKPQSGDLFLSKTGTIGFSALVCREEPFAITQNIAMIRLASPDLQLSRFFLQHFKTPRFKKMLTKKVNQSTIMDLQLQDIRRLVIGCPTIQEQQKIADFLTAVDARIGQLVQKKALLEDYKKGVMQQLFSQAIRFKDDDGSEYPDWEEKKLGEVLVIGSGKDYKHLSIGNIPVYGSGGLMTHVDAKLYEGESVCIGRKGTIDKPQFITGPFWTVDTLFYTHSFKDVLPRFVYALFLRINWRKYNEASGVPSLSKSTIDKIIVEIPSVKEQTKIANFFSAIDSKLESVSKQTDETKTFKKGLLQQMFV